MLEHTHEKTRVVETLIELSTFGWEIRCWAKDGVNIDFAIATIYHTVQDNNTDERTLTDAIANHPWVSAIQVGRPGSAVTSQGHSAKLSTCIYPSWP